MFSAYSRPAYTPASYGYPAPPTAREKYLAALAQAQAAEQEYLAAEALEREEQAIRLRLAEIEASKRQRLPQHFYAGQSSIPTYSPAARPPVDRLELLRLQIEEEERQRAALRAQEALQQERRAAMSWQQQPYCAPMSAAPISQPQDTLSSVESYLKGLLGEDVCVSRRRAEVPAPAPKPVHATKPVTQRTTPTTNTQAAALESYLKNILGDGVTVTVRQPEETSNGSTATAKPAAAPSKPAPAPAAKAPKAFPRQDPISVMRAQLAERFSNEKAGDVKDAIQSIFSALGPDSVSKPKPSPASTKPAQATPAKKSPVSSRSSSPKPEPSPAESRRSISAISASLAKLTADFSMPTSVDFVDGANKLAYTPTNAPIRVYEQALTALLTQLDGIDSFGDDELRKERKAVVERVEERLDALEKEVEGRWKASAPAIVPQEETTTVQDAPEPVVADVAEGTAVVVDAPAANESTVTEDSAALASPVEEPVQEDVAPYDVDDSVVVPSPQDEAVNDITVPSVADLQDTHPTEVEVSLPAIDEPQTSPISHPATPLSPTRTTIEDVEDDADVHSDWSEVEA
ncbi:hypothetical protein CYLTODRAFT_421669 [Cylindrobasidium torrendii FP15055 ss-10]|uniref:BAG domain-containing protein n=1 Tax=Cylindrobasidium torrendii FP15055 ss-10 TaxID=1314674 RepID=A0A0D7BCX9_9AGAR|nr:hypothetical protein CYLTODRAFT_421669 [Cylindrobasidium torrendii FP15055 ss-10]